MYVSLLFVDIYWLSLMIMLDFYIAPESVASHGHPLSIPRGNAGRIEPGTNLAGYQLPITPTSKSHHTGADSTDSSQRWCTDSAIFYFAANLSRHWIALKTISKIR